VTTSMKPHGSQTGTAGQPAGTVTAVFRPAGRRGIAAIELAVVLPLVLLFAFAVVDFGRVVHTYITLANAARCGAEYGSMHNFTEYTYDFWESQVRLAIQQEMEGLSGVSPENLQSTVVTTTDNDGLFRVAVDTTFPFRTVVRWPGVPSEVRLRRQVVMRQIR
jgi:Flp pilus assembly protein TadG